MTAESARRALVNLVRESGRDVLATLTRTTGDLALAEDAVQDATLRALEAWSCDGVPVNPVAWLRLTARRRAVDLVDQAIRLSRLLVRLRPDQAGGPGLLALMLLQDSRREARVDAAGRLVLLAEQDRLRWDAAKIAEAVPLVGEGLRLAPQRPDRYVVQAAIAACHALAPTYAETDWDAVISWYDVLVGLDPGPVVRLNRAVAVGERTDPATGLALVDALAGLETYALWHATRAVLLRRLGRVDEAAAADTAASRLPLNDPQRRLLT